MRTAIVTGGSRGFGRAIAVALAEAGWEVVIDGRDQVSLERTEAELGERVHAVVGDVTDPVHREALVAAAELLGGLDLLVNNASGLGPTPLPALRDVESGQLAALFEANVTAPLALFRLARPLLLKSEGAVVNVTSDAAVEAYAGWGVYGTTKAALEQLSAVLVVEEPTIHIWWLDPGDMRTEMHQAAFPGEDISDRPLPEDVVPALMALLESRPDSGRVVAAELMR